MFWNFLRCGCAVVGLLVTITMVSGKDNGEVVVRTASRGTKIARSDIDTSFFRKVISDSNLENVTSSLHKNATSFQHPNITISHPYKGNRAGSTAASSKNFVSKPMNTFGIDSRQVFDDSSYPWSAVGRVETQGGTCTGTLVGPDLLLTAQHCLYFDAYDNLGWLDFMPSYYNGDMPYGYASLTTVWWLGRIFPDDGLTDLEIALDVALVQLDWNIGDFCGWWSYTDYKSAWNGGQYWSNIGYPGDIGGAEVPVYSGPAAIDYFYEYDWDNGIIAYNMKTTLDTWGGHSGGPVFAFFGENSYATIVGIVSAADFDEISPRPNSLMGGPALTWLINQVRLVTSYVEYADDVFNDDRLFFDDNF